ncbi:hypothetical protein [Bartonella sp. HY038]|uniref:hypothetical protein n=1 Tax=Bartonella sp. HY038 TaxID=2759660 RepID=UPI0015FCE442|nr:hypothetical protein [Bartonella sp. HY038]
MRDAFIVSLNIFKNKNLGKAVESLAPGFLEFFADLHNVSETKLVPVFRSMMKVRLDQLKTIELDFNPGNIVYRQVPNGKVFALFAYITHAVMVDDEIIDDDSVSFVFKANERWYFVDLENPINIDAIKAIYPLFKDIDFNIQQ